MLPYRYLSEIRRVKRYIPFTTPKQVRIIYAQPITKNADGYAYIMVTDMGVTVEMLVDDDQWHRLKCAELLFLINGYPHIIEWGKVYPVHRLIMEYNGALAVDHVNRIKFDNRRCNLRTATHKQNMRNRTKQANCTSTYIGVKKIINKKSITWSAAITIDDMTIYIGCFDDEIKAAKARDISSVKYYKEFAALNFPDCLVEYTSNMADMLYIAYVTNLLPVRTRVRNMHKLIYVPTLVDKKITSVQVVKVTPEPELVIDFDALSVEDMMATLLKVEIVPPSKKMTAAEIFAEFDLETARILANE